MAERMQTFAAIYTNVPELNALLDAEQHRPFFLANLYRLIFSGLSDREFQLLPERSRHLRWGDLTAQHTVTPEDLEKPLRQDRCRVGGRVQRLALTGG